MAKNWVSVTLLLWAIVATLFLFKRQESNFNTPKTIQRTECGRETDVNPAQVFKEASPHVKIVGKNIEQSLGDYDRLPPAYDRVSGLKPHLARYVSQVFHQESVHEKENFTMIMLTYKRLKVLPRLLQHYCKAKRLHKILVIWNDVDSQIPSDILEFVNKCEVTLQFIKEKENKLTNRFKPRAEIETECVCIIDDDRLITDISDLEFGFSVWQRFRPRIIGYEERTYTHQPDGSYFYGVYPGTNPYPGYAIMGTGTAILHRAYLEMYFDPDVLPRGIFEYVDSNMNCEDLSMNVMVTKFLQDVSWQQPAALAVNPVGKIQNMEGEAYVARSHKGLSMQPDHYTKRSECLNKFATFYDGYLPLHYTSVRIHRA